MSSYIIGLWKDTVLAQKGDDQLCSKEEDRGKVSSPPQADQAPASILSPTVSPPTLHSHSSELLRFPPAHCLWCVCINRGVCESIEACVTTAELLCWCYTCLCYMLHVCLCIRVHMHVHVHVSPCIYVSRMHLHGRAC